MVQPTQVSGGGWIADKPVMVGKDTQTRQRSLKTKIVKASHSRQYIRDSGGIGRRGNSNQKKGIITLLEGEALRKEKRGE